MARPGQRVMQMPQPLHLSASSLGRAVISAPTVMAFWGQAVSQGLQGMHCTHSMQATGPRSSRSGVGIPGVCSITASLPDDSS